jgi:hypothetical protein
MTDTMTFRNIDFLPETFRIMEFIQVLILFKIDMYIAITYLLRRKSRTETNAFTINLVVFIRKLPSIILKSLWEI